MLVFLFLFNSPFCTYYIYILHLLDDSLLDFVLHPSVLSFEYVLNIVKSLREILAKAIASCMPCHSALGQINNVMCNMFVNKLIIPAVDAINMSEVINGGTRRYRLGVRLDGLMGSLRLKM